MEVFVLVDEEIDHCQDPDAKTENDRVVHVCLDWVLVCRKHAQQHDVGPPGAGDPVVDSGDPVTEVEGAGLELVLARGEFEEDRSAPGEVAAAHVEGEQSVSGRGACKTETSEHETDDATEADGPHWDLELFVDDLDDGAEWQAVVSGKGPDLS